MSSLSSSAPAATVVIPTRNRKDLLRNSIHAVLNQTVSVQVIVLDDGSTDGTDEMIGAEFRGITYRRYEGRKGPCFLRNRGTELAAAPIVFPIDDDAVMVSPRCIEQTLAEFTDKRVGAVGIPFMNVRKDSAVIQRAPDAEHLWIAHAYIGAAHALRRDLFLKLGGYREHFFYMGEEGDYCIRLLDAGYVTRLGKADPIHHHESPSRSLEHAGIYGRQNDVLFAWQNVPAPHVLPHLAMTTFRGLFFGVRVGHPLWTIRGVLRGYAGCFRASGKRRPVTSAAYRLNRRLKKGGPLRLADVAAELPPMRFG